MRAINLSLKMMPRPQDHFQTFENPSEKYHSKKVCARYLEGMKIQWGKKTPSPNRPLRLVILCEGKVLKWIKMAERMLYEVVNWFSFGYRDTDNE